MRRCTCLAAAPERYAFWRRCSKGLGLWLPSISFVLVLAMAPRVAASEEADEKANAKEHFERGVAAFNARRYAEAREEFDTAYQLSPAYVVLYNVAQVNVALGNSVEAIDAFERYLAQGASSIPASRRAEVEREIAAQRERVSTLEVTVDIAGAQIRLDGRWVGTTPLAEPLRVNAGPHTLGVTLEGYESKFRELVIDGGSAVRLVIELGPRAPSEKTIQHAPQSQVPIAAPRQDSTTPKSGIDDVHSSSKVVLDWEHFAGAALGLAGLTVATVGVVNVVSGLAAAREARERLVEAKDAKAYDAALPRYSGAKEQTERGWIEAGVGIGALAGGVALILLGSSGSEEAAHLTPWVTTRSAGARFTFAF